MRTRETVLLGVGLLLALAPAALAQEQDPTLNESDFDSSPPPSDEAYLDEGASGNQSSAEASTTSEPDPTLGEGDFDMSAPKADTSYLGDDAGSDAADDAGRSAVPMPGVAVALGALAVAALGLRRRA